MSKQNYGEVMALLEWADRKANKPNKIVTKTKKEKAPNIYELLLEEQQKAQLLNKFIEDQIKLHKKEDKKEEKDKKDEKGLTVLQKTVYIVLTSLIGTPLYVFFLMSVGTKMAGLVK